jgi:Tfp pilus assembly protein PilF
MTSLQKSLELSPRQPEIHRVLASIYRAKGDSVRAEEHLQIAWQME